MKIVMSMGWGRRDWLLSRLGEFLMFGERIVGRILTLYSHHPPATSYNIWNEKHSVQVCLPYPSLLCTPYSKPRYSNLHLAPRHYRPQILLQHHSTH